MPSEDQKRAPCLVKTGQLWYTGVVNLREIEVIDAPWANVHAWR